MDEPRRPAARPATEAESEGATALAFGYGAIAASSSLPELSAAVCTLVRKLLAAGIGEVPAASQTVLTAIAADLEQQMMRLARESVLTVEEALRDSEARFRSLADLGSDWYWEKDAHLRFTRFEGRYPSASEDAFATYIGRRVWEVGLEAESGWDPLRQTMEARHPFRDFVHTRVLRNGTRRWYTASGDPIFSDDIFLGYRGVGKDITAQKVAEEQVRYRATHDTLTGLPNRTMFGVLFEQALQSARRYKRGLAVLFIDLDGFKSINDEFGHEAGDYLLQQLSFNLVHAVRSSDVLARLGGDEFVLLVPELHARENLTTLAGKLISASRLPVCMGERECRVSASVGIATFPDDGDDEQSLMKQADHAMYTAKRAGKGTFRFARELRR